MLDRTRARFCVLLEDPAFRFNASHFLTFPDAQGGAVAEPIHGHDFRASVRVEGPLDASGCVVDFIAASKALRTILAEFEHKLILARGVFGASYEETLVSVTISSGAGSVCFPRSLIYWIAGRNASTEEIAFVLLDKFVAALADELTLDVDKYRFALRLEETPGASVEVSC